MTTEQKDRIAELLRQYAGRIDSQLYHLYPSKKERLEAENELEELATLLEQEPVT